MTAKGKTVIGMREPEGIKKDISSLIDNGVEFINEKIEKIDPANKTVKTDKRDLASDYLVISLGAALAPESIPGLTDAFKSNAFNLYDYREAIRIRDALKNFSRGDVVVLVCGLPYKCPVAPNEWSLLLNYFFTRRGVRNDVKIRVCTPEVLPLGGNGPQTGGIVKGLMESVGVEYYNQHKVTSIDPGKNEITFDKGTVHYDLLMAIPPHIAPRVIKESGLTDNEWIPVDRGTMETDFENVYALGDVNKIKIPGEWKQGVPLMLTKGGVFAHYEAKVLAENIANEISGKKERVEYTGRGACFVETGFGRAALASGTFYIVPNPDCSFNKPSRMWHVGKVLFEKYWLSESIFKRPIDILLEKTMYGKYKRIRTH
jgi:sulfide:quinone oxidoreductase